MASKDERGVDPIEQEAKRAREEPERSLLPSNDGLGPGAGETPGANVSAGTSTRDDDAPDVTSTPSLGAPPRRTERPDYRSSQLDGGAEEEGADDA